jgi:hypothetical protein
LRADAKQGDVKIIPFFTTQSFANNRVKSKVNLVKPNTHISASNIVTRLLEGFSGLLHGVLILAFGRVLATPAFGIYPEQPSLIAWHILGKPPDIIYPLMSQKLVTDRVRIDWMVYSVELY